MSKLPAYHIQTLKLINRGIKFLCQNCVDVPKDLLELIRNRERSHVVVTGCQRVGEAKAQRCWMPSLIKQKVETEARLKETIETQKKSPTALKKNLDASPSYHTLEYIEEKLRERLDSFEVKITKNASAAKGNTATWKDHIKVAIKTARVEEKMESEDRQRRSITIIIHGVKEKENDEDKSGLLDKANILQTSFVAYSPTNHRGDLPEIQASKSIRQLILFEKRYYRSTASAWSGRDSSFDV